MAWRTIQPRAKSTRNGYGALNDRIATTVAKRSELLTVLDHPSTPNHNNTAERGARAMEVFTTLVETCKKVFYSPYEYFRLHFRHDPNAPSIANLIQAQAVIG